MVCKIEFHYAKKYQIAKNIFNDFNLKITILMKNNEIIFYFKYFSTLKICLEFLYEDSPCFISLFMGEVVSHTTMI